MSRLLAALFIAIIGSMLSVAAVAAPASAGPVERCEIDNPESCPLPPPAPPSEDWMDQTPPAPTPMPAPRQEPGLDCSMVRTEHQLVTRPGGFRALNYGFTVEYCYNSRRDIVKAFPQTKVDVQLPATERQLGVGPGAIGTITVTNTDPRLPVIIPNVTPPIRTGADNTTGEGSQYDGTYIIDFTFKPFFGALQRYRAQTRVIIDSGGGVPLPPTLQRFS